MPRGVRRYKLVLIETAYNARVNPVWGASGLVGAVAGPVGAAAPVGPAVKAPWPVSKRPTWPKIDRSTPPPDSRQVRFRHRQPETLRTSETRQASRYAREGPAATRACHQHPVDWRYTQRRMRCRFEIAPWPPQAAAQNMQDPYRGRRIFTWRCDGVKSGCFGGMHRYICWARWALELALVALSLVY